MIYTFFQVNLNIVRLFEGYSKEYGRKCDKFIIKTIPKGESKQAAEFILKCFIPNTNDIRSFGWYRFIYMFAFKTVWPS